MAREVFTERLARAAATRRRRTLLIWLGVLIVAFFCIPIFLSSALSPELKVTNNPDSEQARDLIRAKLPQAVTVDEIVIVKGDLAVATRLAGEIKGVKGVNGVKLGPKSADGTSQLVFVDLANDQEQYGDTIDTIVPMVESAGGTGTVAYITGPASAGVDTKKLSEHDLRKGEFGFGVPAALIILCLVFGAIVAAALPLLLAMVSIIIALALLGIVGQANVFSIFAVNMITGMGLALGIDYSLFVLSRFREERTLGRDVAQSIRVAGATSSRAVLFSGVAFVVALAGMLITPLSVLVSLSAGAILVAIVAVCAALTLLPALISKLGDRVNAWRVPYFGRNADKPPREDGFWARAARTVMARPVIWLIAGVAVMLLCAYPILDFRIGASGVATLPAGYTSKDGFDLLAKEFPQASSAPLEIVVEGSGTDAGVARLGGALANTKTFGTPTIAKGNGITLMTVPVFGDPQSAETADAVRALRKDTIPVAFRGTDATVLVGGRPAFATDYYDANAKWLPIVIAIVLTLSFILLTVAFRSIVVPVKAIILNLLSVGAAYGLLVLVFQKGVLTGVFGFQQVDSIEAWVPLFLFSVLFGLSMDYHVFLLSRIKERFERTGDNTEAVAGAVGSTARLITGAAAIIIVVFIGFALGDLVMFQQMGFGVAVALFLDATIVRSVILPASMKLLGARNWYLPKWLEWIPNVGEVEPEPLPERTAAV